MPCNVFSLYLFPDNSPLSPPRSMQPSLPTHTQLYILFIFLNPSTSFQLPVYFYMWDHPLGHDQPDTLFLRCHRLSLAPSLEVGTQESLPAPCCNADWIDLVQVLPRPPQLLCAHGCRSLVTPRTHCFTLVLPDFWSLQPFCPHFHRSLWSECGKRKSYPWLIIPLAFILSTLSSCSFYIELPITEEGKLPYKVWEPY